MRKHWLLFTQTVTVALALLFIVHTLKPELLPNAARGSSRRSGADEVLVHHRNPVPAVQGQMIRQAASDDARADDQDVRCLAHDRHARRPARG